MSRLSPATLARRPEAVHSLSRPRVDRIAKNAARSNHFSCDKTETGNAGAVHLQINAASPAEIDTYGQRTSTPVVLKPRKYTPTPNVVKPQKAPDTSRDAPKSSAISSPSKLPCHNPSSARQYWQRRWPVVSPTARNSNDRPARL